MAPLRPRDQRTRDRPTFTQRGPRPGNANPFQIKFIFYFLFTFLTICMSLSLLDGVGSSESQTGKSHISFVNKGEVIYSTVLFICW